MGLRSKDFSGPIRADLSPESGMAWQELRQCLPVVRRFGIGQRGQRSFDRFSFGEICLPTPPGNPRRKHGDRERRNKPEAVKCPYDRVVWRRTSARTESLADHGSDIGIGRAWGEKSDKGCEGELQNEIRMSPAA